MRRENIAGVERFGRVVWIADETSGVISEEYKLECIGGDRFGVDIFHQRWRRTKVIPGFVVGRSTYGGADKSTFGTGLW